MTGSAGKFEKIAFVASEVPQALDARERLIEKYGNADPMHADVIVALGGDGLMLQTLRTYLKDAIPIYGMNRSAFLPTTTAKMTCAVALSAPNATSSVRWP